MCKDTWNVNCGVWQLYYCQLRYNRFQQVREGANNDDRLGRPSTSTADENIEAVNKMILDKLIQY